MFSIRDYAEFVSVKFFLRIQRRSLFNVQFNKGGNFIGVNQSLAAGDSTGINTAGLHGLSQRA